MEEKKNVQIACGDDMAHDLAVKLRADGHSVVIESSQTGRAGADFGLSRGRNRHLMVAGIAAAALAMTPLASVAQAEPQRRKRARQPDYHDDRPVPQRYVHTAYHASYRGDGFDQERIDAAQAKRERRAQRNQKGQK